MEELRTLVLRAQGGDLDAYGRIVRRFQDMAYGYAYARLGDFHLAEDAAQEAFVEAFRSLGSLEEPAAFPGWFRRIVSHRCSRLTRGRHVPTVPLEVVGHMTATEPSPVDAAGEREMADKVLEAIQALPDDQRTATTLFYINGYSQKEIAEFLEVPVTTVNNRLAASRKRLKQRMLTMVEQTLHNNAPDERLSRAVIEEITESESPQLSQMHELFAELFPNHPHMRPFFGELLGDRLDDQGRHKAQIFTSVIDGQVVGIAQIFYRVIGEGLMTWLDWIGVARTARRRGIGSGLFAQIVAAMRDVAREYDTTPVGVVLLVGPDDVAALGMYQKLGAQVRHDLVYTYDGDDAPGGSLIVWYPLSPEHAQLASKSLAWQLWQFGGLPAEEFRRRYGKPE